MDTLIRTLQENALAKLRMSIQTVLEDANRRGRNGGLRDSDLTDTVISEMQSAVEQIANIYTGRYEKAGITSPDLSEIIGRARRDIEGVVAGIRNVLGSYVHEPGSRDSLLARFDASSRAAVLLELEDVRKLIAAQARANEEHKASVRRAYILAAATAAVALVTALLSRK